MNYQISHIARFFFVLLISVFLANCDEASSRAPLPFAEPASSPSDDEPKAEPIVIEGRYRDIIEAGPRDSEFEAAERVRLESVLRDGIPHEVQPNAATLRELKCTADACFVLFEHSTPLEVMEFHPLQFASVIWNNNCFVRPDDTKLITFAVCARSGHALPEVDFAE